MLQMERTSRAWIEASKSFKPEFMAFKTLKSPTVSLESPESLFHDLRSRKIAGLLSQQADLLRKYTAEAVKESDVALQLATGSGKTLVGLLIAEWRRLKFKERVVYLCPTNQLVHQVVDMANAHYGLKVHGFVGPKAKYEPAAKGDYIGGEAVAVTSYSSLFNVNPFFENPNVIVLDDAHSAENYIPKMWSLRISRFDNEKIYKAVVAVFLEGLSHSDQQRLVEPAKNSWDYNWVEKIPTPTFIERVPELINVLNTNIEDRTDLAYTWGLLQNNLHACHCYLDPREVLIRPIIPPTFSHEPFAGAKQRIYMSATLGEGGDLERITGRPKVTRLKIEGWEKQGIGRRFFLFPQRSLSETDTEKLILQVLKKAGRSLVIVPDDQNASEYRTTIKETLKIPTFEAKDIEISKTPFTKEPHAVAVVANRYDGIDFPEDQCRMLVVGGLPRATNAQEKFIMSRMGAGALLDDRILTRIVQAFGRCTRSATDFAAVLIEGEDLLKYLMPTDRRKFLHPELQGELQFGIDNSKDQKAEDFLENLDDFFKQNTEWKNADGAIVQIRQDSEREQLPGTGDLQAAVKHEIAYQEAMWSGDYLGALDACGSVLGSLNHASLKGYRALWSYMAGSAAWLAHIEGTNGMEVKAREQFANAQKATSGVTWLARLAKLQPTGTQIVGTASPALCAQVENLEAQFEKLGTVHGRKYDEEEKLIADNIKENDHEKFERAHEHLGNLLGFRAGKVESNASPDPWWVLSDDVCLVFEDHSNPKEGDGKLDVTKARQVASHPNWVRKNVPLPEKANIIPVLVTPFAKAWPESMLHLKEVSVWNLDDFRKWTIKALIVIRELRRQYPGPDDLAWRAVAADRLQGARLDSQSILDDLLPRTAEKAFKVD
jgi:hypothetical protein